MAGKIPPSAPSGIPLGLLSKNSISIDLRQIFDYIPEYK